jgi:ribosomal protein L11 methyltransferase
MKAAALTRVWARIPAGAAEALVADLAAQGYDAAVWEDAERSNRVLSVYLKAPAAAPAAAEALRAAGRAHGLALVPHRERLPAQDWAESWKRFFRAGRVSPRLAVRPPWEPWQAAPGERVVTIDPGLSFGTGNHATTRACLQFLDLLAAENPARDVLDAGCGSGILAIAAAKLGFRSVTAFDVDPEAVRSTRENAAANAVRLRAVRGSVQTWRTRADIVVANILAADLIAAAPRLAACVRPGPGAALVLAGILSRQYARVRRRYAACGFRERAVIETDGWRSGWFERTGCGGRRHVRPGP